MRLAFEHQGISIGLLSSMDQCQTLYLLCRDLYFLEEFPLSSCRVVCDCSSDMTAGSDLVFEALFLHPKFVVSYEHDSVVLDEVCLSKADIKFWSLVRSTTTTAS